MFNTTPQEKLNTSFGFDIEIATTGMFYRVTELIERYCLPFICLFGLVGNSLATITFLQKSLRQTSCSLYLAARSISDNGFLLTLLIMWISGAMEYQLNKIQGICNFLMFLPYVCGCVSVWLVVFVTTETYIRICHPFVVKQWCTTRNAKIAICILFVLVLCLNHFPLWISDVNCSPRPKYAEVMQAFVYIDTVLTLALPSILMTCLIVTIVIRLFQHHEASQNARKSKSHTTQVTKMLLAASVTFITLNLPSHVIRLRLMIGTFMKGSTSAPDFEAAIQILAQLLYYISLSINLIIYLTFGSNFRKIFKEKFQICKQEPYRGDNPEIRHLVQISGTKDSAGNPYRTIIAETSNNSSV